MSDQKGAEADELMLVDIVFDGPPGPVCGRFIESEDSNGKSIRVGDWVDRKDGTWALRILAKVKSK